LVLGGSAAFAGTAIVWPFNYLRRIQREEIEIQTLADRVDAGIAVCKAKPNEGEIADCFSDVLKLLDRDFEKLRKPASS
jgi:hypothetical protein